MERIIRMGYLIKSWSLVLYYGVTEIEGSSDLRRDTISNSCHRRGLGLLVSREKIWFWIFFIRRKFFSLWHFKVEFHKKRKEYLVISRNPVNESGGRGPSYG